MLFKMAAIWNWKHLYCIRSCFSKCLPFECSSIVSGHAFQNAGHLNARLLCQVMLFKMAALWNWTHLHCVRSCLSKCPPFECRIARDTGAKIGVSHSLRALTWPICHTAKAPATKH
jgi:hypothetical protein